MRRALEEEFPESARLYTDSYILSVMTAPDTKVWACYVVSTVLCLCGVNINVATEPTAAPNFCLR